MDEMQTRVIIHGQLNPELLAAPELPLGCCSILRVSRLPPSPSPGKETFVPYLCQSINESQCKGETLSTEALDLEDSSSGPACVFPLNMPPSHVPPFPHLVLSCSAICTDHWAAENRCFAGTSAVPLHTVLAPAVAGGEGCISALWHICNIRPPPQSHAEPMRLGSDN